MSDEHPELAGYEPSNGKPLRNPRVLWVMRVVIVAGIVGLILPGIMTMLTVSTNTANRACAFWVSYAKRDATGSSARFELFGPGGVGWQCYSVGAFGGDKIVASLGIIPSGARLGSPHSVDS